MIILFFYSEWKKIHSSPIDELVPGKWEMKIDLNSHMRY